MKLNNQQYKILTEWIAANLIRTNKYNNHYQTGTLKASFEHSSVGFYIDLETFNSVLLDCGYIPKFPEDMYWTIKISDKSPAITEYIGVHQR